LTGGGKKSIIVSIGVGQKNAKKKHSSQKDRWSNKGGGKKKGTGSGEQNGAINKSLTGWKKIKEEEEKGVVILYLTNKQNRVRRRDSNATSGWGRGDNGKKSGKKKTNRRKREKMRCAIRDASGERWENIAVEWLFFGKHEKKKRGDLAIGDPGPNDGEKKET